jgi:hypothetical protein
MKNLGFRIAMIVGGVSILAAALMQLFNGVYFLRNLPSIFPDLPVFFTIVISITAAACILIVIRINPSLPVLTRIEEGASVPLEERLHARKRLAEVPGLIVLVNVIGFFLGPIITITAKALANGTSINVLDTILYVALNSAIGLMAALQEISFTESATASARRALAIVEYSETRGEVSLRARLVIVALGTALLTGTLITMAGLGFVRGLARSSEAAWDWSFIGQMVILLVFSLGWALLLILTTAQSLLSQLRMLDARMSGIASGDADLSTRASIVSFDEIGRLTGSINSVIRRLHSLVEKVRDAAEGVSSSSIHPADTTKAAAKAVAKIENTLGAVREAVKRQNETVGGAHASIARRASPRCPNSPRTRTSSPNPYARSPSRETPTSVRWKNPWGRSPARPTT